MSRMNQGEGSDAAQTMRETASNVSQTLRDAGSHVRNAASEKIG